jgi:membrane protein implicated in regulation of membrane protease activity
VYDVHDQFVTTMCITGGTAWTWSFVMAALILAVATPFICAFGTSLQDSRAPTYAEEATHRHSTTASAIAEGEPVVDFNEAWYTVQAKWNRSGQDHVDVVEWPQSCENRRSAAHLG